MSVAVPADDTTFKLPNGGAQAALTMTCPKELEDMMITLWAGHAEWMKAPHHRGGDQACLFYHQYKSVQIEDFTKDRPELGASARPTGHTTITITEFYATKAGLDKHSKFFHAGAWEGSAEFGAPMETGKCKFLGPGYGETPLGVANGEFQLE